MLPLKKMKLNSKKIKEINFFKIIKESFALAWQKKYLWLFGLFITLGSIGSFNFSFEPEKNAEDKEVIEKIHSFIISHLPLFITIAIILALLFILFFLLSILGRGSLIKSIALELEDKKSNFKLGLNSGKKYFKNLFNLVLLSFLFIFGILIVMALPIIFLFKTGVTIPAIILSVLAVLIFIPLLFLLYFLINLGQIYIVLGDLSLKQSIENAYILFKKNMLVNLVLIFILWFVKITLFIAVAILLIPVIIIFALFGLLLYFLFKLVGIIIAVSLGALALICIFFIVNSFYEVLRQAVWIKFFQKIAKPKPTKELLEKIPEPKTQLADNVIEEI